ncbi:ATP-NAD kinase-like domain-containing protein [Lipomyces oligophaga]|uniref:ATP-NAD kinase-like domain-containing protein n=1 Tax=Lipomyces oligophaga TaxID=45792 RepID=UPI0034D01AD4
MVPDSLFVYSIPESTRVKLILEDKFLHLDYEQAAQNALQPTGCLPAIACSAPTGAHHRNSIYYFNILWVEYQTTTPSSARATLCIDYCSTTANKTAALEKVTFAVDPDTKDMCDTWIEQLLQRAYCLSAPPLTAGGPTRQINITRCKKFMALVNPFSGQGRAIRYFRELALPIFNAAHCEVDEIQTQYKCHATDLVSEAPDLETKYDAIVCCSGDGIVHEVFNGLAQRPNPAHAFASVPVCQLPGGSGNALCANLVGCKNVPFAALCVVKGVPVHFDLCSLSQGNKRSMTFLSQALGMIADCDIGTEHLRWMGESRFTLGVVQRVLTRASYPAEIYMHVVHDSRAELRKNYRHHSSKPYPHDDLPLALPDQPEPLVDLKYGTINDSVPGDWFRFDAPNLAVFYAGQMPWMSSDALFFPAALPRDGLFDIVIIDSKVPILEIAKILLGVEHGSHFESSHVHYYKVDAYRIIPKAKSGYISIDGEFFDFAPFQVEIHPSLGTVLSHTPSFQAPGV